MAVEFKDYYRILGVDRNADDKTIKSAYRKLARKYHPDVAKGKDSGERFREVTEAYEVLSDPEKRRRYDTLGPDWQRYAQQPSPEGQPGGVHFEYGDAGIWAAPVREPEAGCASTTGSVASRLAVTVAGAGGTSRPT